MFPAWGRLLLKYRDFTQNPSMSEIALLTPFGRSERTFTEGFSCEEGESQFRYK